MYSDIHITRATVQALSTIVLSQETRLAYQVVIAGAGPVRLFLACELRLAGISVLVLERMEDTRTPLKANLDS